MLRKRLCSIVLLLSMVFMLTACGTDTINTEDLTEPQDSVVTDLASAEKDTDIQEESKTPVELDENSSFEVHYLDVGQADAALVLCDDKTMLIDGGNPGDSSLIAAYLKKHSISHLDYVICSHAHDDHVGGLPGALSVATAGAVYAPKTENDIKSYQSFKSKAQAQGLIIQNPVPGSSIKFGSSTVDFLGPITENSSDLNNTSIVLKITYTNLLIYIDDGISGVTMNRPDYIRMIEDFENNKSSALFVKDLSRIGRNYIEVGKLTEEFLPEHDIRLVAVSDNIDTTEGENELAPIKNLFNEWYARDISKKRRISNKIKGNSGEPLSTPPYGYMKNPDDKKTWLIDEEAASVVRRIFSMYLQDFGTEQIAVTFEQEQILTPVHYWASKGIRKPHKKISENPYAWNSSTVVKILNTQEYCGDIINFKTYSKSYKNKKRIANDPENIVTFKDVNPAIIERAVYEKIQEKRGKVRKRKKADGEKNMFSGLLICADCGSNLNFHFNQGNKEITYFNCTGYNRGKRKICESSHYIRTDFLEQVVLGEIRRLTRFATKYENAFAKLVMGSSLKSAEQEMQFKESELKKLQARDKELDILFEKIYEDNAMGKISDDRFAKLSVKYEDEQKAVNEKMQNLKDEISNGKSKNVSTDMFIATVQKYTRAKKLTPQMLNELIDKIEVYQSEKIDGKTVQRLKIHYTCIGTLEIPDMDLIPENNVKVHTRQGVDVHFDTRACVAV